jgi:hypothetical protein
MRSEAERAGMILKTLLIQIVVYTQWEVTRYFEKASYLSPKTFNFADI